jgi:wobble nucleotide-excising tRNase
LSSQHAPKVIVDCSGGPPLAIFDQGAWNRTLPNVAIFDDAFVDANMYSGLTVEPEHRQRLHELVLGTQGVGLHRRVEELAAEIELHNQELRRRSGEIPVTAMQGYSIDAFCALPVVMDAETAIQDTQRRISATREQGTILNGSVFEAIELPGFDISGIAALLARDLPELDAAAATRVQQHVATLGRSGEAWLAGGLQRLPKGDSTRVSCPFCLQDVGESAIIDHYRAYFSKEYEELKRAVVEALSAVTRVHGGDATAAFERAVRITVERRQFWGRFCDLPEVSVDTAEIARAWREAREAIVAILQGKQAAPLESLRIPSGVIAVLAAFETHRQQIASLNVALRDANAALLVVKEQAASGSPAALESDLRRLQASKARHAPEAVAACTAYLDAVSRKAETVSLRDQARVALDQYRKDIFPTYQQSVNGYLQRFNAGFRIDSVASVNTRSGTSCNYSVIIDTKPVPVAGGAPQAGTPSFRNTLSAGDRNTLGLAFFFSFLDQDPSLATKLVIIDDPISSLDEHRAMATVHELRRLVTRTRQVIVLSHDRRFLARVWDGAARGGSCTAVQLARDGQGSSLATWNVKDDATTEYDRRHAMLREYQSSGKGTARDVATAIRPILEGFVRVARPEHFPPSSLLGPFLGVCAQRLGKDDEIFDEPAIRTLREIVEYANRFHHDTNPAWETESINDGELRGFVDRVMAFLQR